MANVYTCPLDKETVVVEYIQIANFCDSMWHFASRNALRPLFDILLFFYKNMESFVSGSGKLELSKSYRSTHCYGYLVEFSVVNPHDLY